MSLELISTADGSHSLLNTDLDETYHSTHGAIQESVHVFIKNGLDFRIKMNPSNHLSVLEVGFGTGLNALLAMKWAVDFSIDLRYVTLEAFPLKSKIIDQINYPALIGGETTAKNFRDIHAAPWNEPVAIAPHFVLEKKLIRLEEFTSISPFADVIFFDAFAPSKQPELWEFAILEKMKKCLKPAGVFVTYCAKGQLKRDLKTLGFAVETLAGPPGKKEMVRATV